MRRSRERIVIEDDNKLNNDEQEQARIKFDLRPLTPGQADYCEAMRRSTITICDAPAGTGKTYLAAAMAADMFNRELVDRLVFARPAVEAGERLGFLPGDSNAKVAPYLMPIFDALRIFFTNKTIQTLQRNGKLEVVPLAFMRGRNFKNAFIILDEAQNATKAQLRMFLTRFCGGKSKVVVTGDSTQSDLPSTYDNTLVHAINKLANHDLISIVRMTHLDVVRHPLVAWVDKQLSS